MAQYDGTTEDGVTAQAIGNGTRLAPAGAVFIAVRGMSLHNEIRIVRSDREMSFNQDIKAIVAKKVDGRFLYYAMLAQKPALLSAVEAAGHGTGRLPTDKLSAVPVPCLSKSEQVAIASILGALDDKIDVNRRMNETLEAMARAIFKDWFVDFSPTRAKMEGRPPYLAPDLWALFPDRLNEEGKPEGWAETSFAEVVEVIGGGTPRTSEPAYWDGDIPWFSVVDAPTGKDVWVIDTAKHITAAGVSSCSTQILPIGTTILSARGTVGKIALVGAPMAMNQSCYGLRDRHDPTGSFGYFSTQSIVETLRQRAHGSVFDTITRDTLQAVSVVFPSTEVVGAFADHVAPLLRQIRHNLQEVQTLATTRDLLVPKLMSGGARIGQVLEAPEASE